MYVQPMAKQKENSLENITWSGMGTKRSIVLLFFFHFYLITVGLLHSVFSDRPALNRFLLYKHQLSFSAAHIVSTLKNKY